MSNLVLWGFRTDHQRNPELNYLPMKLEPWTREAESRRDREGWITSAYAPGVKPEGLLATAYRMRLENDVIKLRECLSEIYGWTDYKDTPWAKRTTEVLERSITRLGPVTGQTDQPTKE